MHQQPFAFAIFPPDLDQLIDDAPARPIVGGQLHSTDRGPLLETVLRLIRGEHSDSPHFARFVARNHYLLELIDDPGNGSLSRYEIAKLNSVAERFDGNDDWEVVEAAIALPESQRNTGANLAEIPLEHVVEAVGRGSDPPFWKTRQRMQRLPSFSPLKYFRALPTTF